jgi:ferredoxin-NADP reductase
MISTTVTITERKDITHDVILLSFNVPEDFIFKAGQFVTLMIEKNGERKPRSYSIFNPPSQKGKLDLCIKIVPDGFASEVFKDTKVGDSFEMKGPLGHFFFEEDENEEYWFIGCGTGLAPLYSMIAENLAKLPNKKFVLLFSNKYKNDLLFHDELKKLEKEHNNFKYIQTVTREEWEGPCGRVQKHFPEDFHDKTFYICGIKPLVESTKEVLLEKGVNQKNIKFERYS